MNIDVAAGDSESPLDTTEHSVSVCQLLIRKDDSMYTYWTDLVATVIHTKRGQKTWCSKIMAATCSTFKAQRKYIHIIGEAYTSLVPRPWFFKRLGTRRSIHLLLTPGSIQYASEKALLLCIVWDTLPLISVTSSLMSHSLLLQWPVWVQTSPQPFEWWSCHKPYWTHWESSAGIYCKRRATHLHELYLLGYIWRSVD